MDCFTSSILLFDVNVEKYGKQHNTRKLKSCKIIYSIINYWIKSNHTFYASKISILSNKWMILKILDFIRIYLSTHYFFEIKMLMWYIICCIKNSNTRSHINSDNTWCEGCRANIVDKHHTSKPLFCLLSFCRQQKYISYMQ